jgi:2-polyprenyl-3-methyl-5-hydroxy-6-metoxy-1,4-benzoquinol methylase
MDFVDKQIRRVKEVWGRGSSWKQGEIRHWLQHPLVQARINSKITDGSIGDRYQYFIHRYVQERMPVERALTLGCGNGELERGLSQYNFAKAHEGVDLSDDAIRNAKEAATRSGLAHISYRTGELNTLRLNPRAYEVIFGISSVHHVEKLEHLFEQVRAALKPSGYFFLDEYVGPTKFQWTDDQLVVMNEQLKMLPDQLKQSVSERGKYKRQVIRKTLKLMNEADPSEAVRSAEIIPLLSRYFRIVEFKGYGGALLHELLYDIAGNFGDHNPGSLDYLQRLFDVEDQLIASGRLDHDFAVIIAAV